MINTKTAEIFT